MKKLVWVESTGGPLILLSKKSCQLWSGTDSDDNGESDYGRACSVEDFIGILDIEGENVLVLGDEPLITTAVNKNDILLIVRWCYGENKKRVDGHVREIDSNLLEWELAAQIVAPGGEYYLMDASLCFGELEDGGYMTSKIQSGTYGIYTAEYEPDSETKLLLHKLERVE